MAIKSGTKPPLTPEAALEYVRAQSQGGGGWREARCGLWNNTLPSLLGARDVRLSAFVSAILWALLVFVSAALPIAVRKVYELKMRPPGQSAPEDGEGPLMVFGIPVDGWDAALLSASLFLALAPRVRAWLRSRAERSSRSRALESLAASIRVLPTHAGGSKSAVISPCAEALSGLTREIAQLIDDNNGDLTDAVLLVFGDQALQTMSPLVRTAAGEQTGVSKPAAQFQAFYVAKLAQIVAEHDFAGPKSPFPPVRLTPLESQTPAEYKSVLFLPVLARIPASSTEPDRLVDACFGVVCVHSKQPYRFWRYGDHRKLRGSLANKAWVQAKPYMQVIAHCLRVDYPHMQV